jgi:coenzyme F420-reducing hydrogenase delta subunit/ferredoxin
VHRIQEEASSKVLILGGDEYGIRIAEVLKNNAFDSTVLFEPNEKYPANPKAEIVQGLILNISGFMGNFSVQIETSSNVTHSKFGYIVAAQPPHRKSKINAFAINDSKSIYNLSEFKDYLKSGGRLPERKDRWRHIAFFFDLKGSSEVSQFETLVSVLDRLETEDRLQPYVFTRNLKVASPGLDARFRYHRQRGVVFFKFDNGDPVINQDENGSVITFVEPLLGEQMELTPDIMVFDEILGPTDSLKPILNLIPSSPAFAPYLQPESSRFQGVETPKAGIYAVGPSRGVFDIESLNADVQAVTVAILKASMEKPDLSGKGVASVDHGKCTFCLTCLRLCPHGAIGFISRPEIDPLSCRACGVCVVECPMGAIEIRPLGDFTHSTETVSRPIKLIVCAKSGLQAAAKIKAGILSDVEIIALQCAGNVSAASLLEYFRDGARGVIVAGCFKGNCASIYGSTLAERRVGYAAEILNQAGFDPERLEFTSVAGNTPETVVEAIMKLKSRIHHY